jgi:chloride channel protein, CIC family
MTEKIARLGARVVSDYVATFSIRCSCPTSQQRRCCAPTILSSTSAHGRRLMRRDEDRLVVVITRRDLFDSSETVVTVSGVVKRPAAIVFDDSSLRDAVAHVVRENVGRLPVVARDQPDRVIGLVTRSDLIAAHARRLDGERLSEPHFRFKRALAEAAVAHVSVGGALLQRPFEPGSAPGAAARARRLGGAGAHDL